MSVDAVLGVSLSATRAGVVVLEGIGADARTVIRDAVAVSASGMDVVAAAVAQAARTAMDRGYPVHQVGLTCTADAEPYGLELVGLLADSGIPEIEVFEPTDAVAALAEVIASSRRSRCATLSLITKDKTIAVLADDRDGVHRPAVALHHDDDAALVSLDQLVADWGPGAVFAMVPHALAVDGFSGRLERALAPRMIAVIDAELGLARGAALAAGHAAFASALAVEESTVPVRQGLHRAGSLLVAAVVVTLLFAALTVALVRGALFGGESPTQASIGVDVAGNAAQQSRQATPPPSSAVAPPVSAAEKDSAVVPPVSTPRQVEPQFAEAGEPQRRKRTEPFAEAAPAPVAPPIGAPLPSAVEEPVPSPVQDAIAFVEQALGIDLDNDGLIGGQAATPAPNSDHAP